MPFAKKVDWEAEHKNVYNLSLQGLTLQEIGNKYQVSRQRVMQVLKKYYPFLTANLRGNQLVNAKKRQELLKEKFDKRGRTNWMFVDDLARRMSDSFRRKRQNAKSTKWGWDLTFNDIEWITVCPILGIDIDWFADSHAPNSPSYDRTNPKLGYIKGNVRLMSLRANRIKNDGTADEHIKIAEYMKQYAHLF